MGIVASLILIAFGAILTWAVNAHVNGIDITAGGVILMVVGLVSFAWFVWQGPGNLANTEDTGIPAFMTDEAKASDVLALVERARAAVRERFGIELELEMKVVGEPA